MLDQIASLSPFYRNAVIIGLELSLLILGFLLFIWILRFGFSRFDSISWFSRYRGRAGRIHRFIRYGAFFLVLIFCAAVLLFNGLELYRGNDLFDHGRSLLKHLPAGFWGNATETGLKGVVLIIVAMTVTRAIQRVLARLKSRALEYKQLRSNDESVARFFARLNQIQYVTIWFGVLFVLTDAIEPTRAISEFVLIALRIYLIISIGLLVVNAVAAIVDSLDGLSRKYASVNHLLDFYKKLRGLIPLLRRCLEYIVYVSVTSLVLLQVDFIARFAEYGPRIIQGIGIFFIARVVIELVNLVIDRALPIRDEFSDEERQRLETIVPIIKTIQAATIYFFALVLILRSLGFDPLPLLAGAGIAGIIFGLGAQSLLNDVISGFFIIFENLFMVGDFIETGKARGTVESIAIRTTRIRDPDGQQHIIRNGQLSGVVNFSRGYTCAVVEVGIAPDSDLDRAYSILTQIGLQLKQENPDVLEATQVSGLEDFSGPELVVRTVTKVMPGCHAQAGRQLRKLIKESFDREGIVIPFDRRIGMSETGRISDDKKKRIA